MAIIARLMAKRPDDRYQSASEVAEVLGLHLADMQQPTSLAPLASAGLPGLPDSRRPGRGVRRPRAILAAMAGGIVLLAVPALLTSRILGPTATSRSVNATGRSPSASLVSARRKHRVLCERPILPRHYSTSGGRKRRWRRGTSTDPSIATTPSWSLTRRTSMRLSVDREPTSARATSPRHCRTPTGRSNSIRTMRKPIWGEDGSTTGRRTTPVRSRNTRAPSSWVSTAASSASTAVCPHAALKHWDEAIADYSEAIRLRPEDPWGFANRAAAHATLRHWDKAIADYSEVLRRQPNDPLELRQPSQGLARQE